MTVLLLGKAETVLRGWSPDPVNLMGFFCTTRFAGSRPLSLSSWSWSYGVIEDIGD